MEKLHTSQQSSFRYFALQVAIDLMKANHVQEFWIVKNEVHYKRRNLTMDKACWEGWIVVLRQKVSDNIFCDNCFIFMRRKFIPPILDKSET